MMSVSALAIASLVLSAGGSDPVKSCASMAGECPVKAASMAQVVSMEQYAPTKDIVATAVGAGSFNTLAAALKAAGLVETLQGAGPFTVFAPTDEAFAKLPAGTVENLLKPENKATLIAVLTYHVVPGNVMAKDVVTLSHATTVNGQRVDIRTKDGKVMIDNATVAKTDIACTNGVIHVIDSVILPVSNDIVATASEAGSFGTLLAAAKAAGLVETLQSEGPFTVFAPTDEAFAKLPKGTVEDLLKPENKAKLASILTYHVLPGRVYADQVGTTKAAPTVNGQMVNFSVYGGVAKINGATITATDLETSNGVIHVIDTVILPK